VERWKEGKAAYNSEGKDKCPKGSHRVCSNGLQHPHVVLSVLCLDCIRLVSGHAHFFVKVVDMFRNPLGLDLWGGGAR